MTDLFGTGYGPQAGRNIPNSVTTVDPSNGPIANAPAPTNANPAQNSAMAIIQQMLDQSGLGDLAPFAWGLITQDATVDEITTQIRNTAQYKDRFAGNVQRQKEGKRPLSEAEYIATEEGFRAVNRQFGLPRGFHDDRASYAALIAGDVAPDEWKGRVQQAQDYVMSAPEDQRALFAYQGVSQGDMVAQVLNPEVALPIIQRKLDMARLGGSATRAGLSLSAGQAERLATLGITPDQGQQGFTHIAAAQQLLTGLPGENAGAITQDEALAGTLEGNAAAQEKLSRRARQRVAAFEGSSQFATGQTGFAGLGIAR